MNGDLPSQYRRVVSTLKIVKSAIFFFDYIYDVISVKIFTKFDN